MSEQEREIYEFAAFRLDVTERFLVHSDSDERVQLSEKAFETLCVLVKNAGHLVKKNDLLNEVWVDSFVEENNLNKCIHAIRRALSEKQGEHQFIETVKKHGFRFIVEVRRVQSEEISDAAHKENVFQSKTKRNASAEFPHLVKQGVTQRSGAVVAIADWQQEAKDTDEAVGQNARLEIAPQKPTNESKYISKYRLPLFASAITVLLIFTIVIAAWFARKDNHTTFESTVISAPFALEKLSTNGKVFHAIISPDGKNVVYTNISPNDKRSVWLRNLETDNNVEIIPSSDNIYFGLAHAPDGNSFYFARRQRNFDGQADIYRISIYGGIPKKIISETQGWMSISPDGAKISFVRCYYREDDYCSLWIADSGDGKNEKKLITRPRPFRITDNEFSPDGKLVAFAAGQSENASNDFSLSVVDLESGAESLFTTEKFFNIISLTWLPDQKNLFLTASRSQSKNFHIWQISALTGKAEPITKDSESYSNLSIDKTASRLVATKFRQDFRLRVLNLETVSPSLILADVTSVAFAPDGKIFYVTSMSGNDDIWSVNPNGDGQKQLTNDTADDRKPIVAPDNSAIYFASNRTGSIEVWRMNADGSNQTQITHKTGGFPLFVSPDGEWVYFHHEIDRTLWRVSIRSSEEQVVLNKLKYRFAISPDGTLAAFSENIGRETFLFVASIANGQTAKTFTLPNPKGTLVEIAWLPDGKGLVYILATDVFHKNTVWHQPFDAASPRKIAEVDDEQISGESGLAISPDGKSFAVVQGSWRHDAVLLKGLK